MSKNGNQLKAGAIISYLQMGLNIVIGLVYTPIMIRLLGQSEYGLYNTVASTVSMLSILRMGFNNSYIRYYSIYKRRNDEQSINKLNGLFLLLFSLIGIIAFLCGIYLTFNLSLVFSLGLTPKEYEIARVLMILLTINLALSFPMGVFANIISAHEQFIVLKSLDIVKNVLGPLITLPLLFMGYRSITMVAVSVGVSIVVDICYLYFVLKVLKCRFVFSIPEKDLFYDLFAFTIFIAIELIVDQINWNVDKIILARFRGTTMVAIYSVGYSLYTYYQMFSSSISGVFTPRIHSIVNSAENEEAQRVELTELFTRVGRIQFIILTLVSTGVIFFGEFFITNIWAGEAYKDAYFVSVLLILSSTIALIQNLGIEIQRAEFKHQFRSIVYVFMAGINFILSIILCKSYGAIGCAIGTALSLVLANGLIMNIYYHKRCNIDIIMFWKEIARLSLGVIIPIISGVVIRFIIPCQNLLVYLLEILVYVIIYAISMWKIGMNEYEQELIKKLVKKIWRL